ncbi:RHH-type proline utilization regulon transcriptional repressor/proline dehydrogenase/delta 1-pyrroline-5-carboxylate dehydrogenase [Devosia subaequoris]|uniref:Bifunctional protein PutA n=1 Tax=Devosia subaequoris TaxID=395930 RepID=A0A7W6IKZ6_9HYPH|nr:bifunctional proline dehydrogenase/L-glutamate gamma-semialdehyde dehydrogenase PutA [Devosia subaequoris]MBB4051157.1 RHH-type proline utilization regulon transcriptional repressor/proline dehydrogenase/delta 1-pyrroline-5-carboxylate dehydrogenase [Devosia subaequoris]MCP1208178.1 bifunctional proline dehydrogenase/L-glutamate gamma-semialdehyde dehydrogenase PutA [Devosia subaequoris]
MPQTSPRQLLRARLYADETTLVRDLIGQADLDEADRVQISQRAVDLVHAVRNGTRLGLMESFLAEYGLDSEEGLALMSLAEALLRVPDSETVDALIHDKIGGADWARHFGGSESPLVNFSSWALNLTAEVLGDPEIAPKSALHRAVARLGEPVIRTAVSHAMRLMGSQFVFGRTIDEAVAHAKKPEALGYRYSYDMLGEAARTAEDAQRYFQAYLNAINALAPHCIHGSVRDNPGISVKLSALHPRYEYAQRERVMSELVEVTRQLALAAAKANMGFNVDAEEADRLDLSLDVIQAVLETPELAGWNGFGVVVQAYGKRVLPLIDWLEQTAARLDRRIMVRLVKGAYWDAEIKRAQVMGLPGYPVFTRKAATDVSYIAAARKLLDAEHIYPQFATHNAHTAAAVLHLAELTGRAKDSYEFQRLHGMGEQLHDVLRKSEGTTTRIYAPVGAHKDLLAYLVRRLLENGANGSFVYQIADDDIPAETVAEDPIGKLLVLGEDIPNPAIPEPSAIFGDRRNSEGLDLTDPLAFGVMETARDAFATHRWQAASLGAMNTDTEILAEVINPADRTDKVGEVRQATPAQVQQAIAAAAKSTWSEMPVAERAAKLRRTADLYQANAAEFFAVLAREAGKSWADAVAELREAVDFLRYYADEAHKLTAPARGPFVCISPWNFPLAIFTGQVAAALVAGNPVLAKPAPQTPLIAWRAVQLMHEAGLPEDAVQLLPGGPEVGAQLTSNPAIAGVAFTGSLPTARRIEQSMAQHLSPHAPLIAETGGLNAMVVDTTALTEQAVRDIITSAFQSAGQRCSALRILYVQEEAYERTLEMLKGAMNELALGNPWHLKTDVGPIIDATARDKITAYIGARTDRVLHRLQAPEGGTFVAPTVLRVNGIEDLPEEIFGPVLHVATFKGEELGKVISAINASGYGLTFGMHTRISSRVKRLANMVHVGNIYVNRNQIGAVVGSQPFGGEGLSGTGPKAGGPHYLPRFTQGDTSLQCGTLEMPGPTGESNCLHVAPRGTLLCLGPAPDDVATQMAMAEEAGCQFETREIDLDHLRSVDGFDAIAWFGDIQTLKSLRQALSQRDGALLPILTGRSDIARLQLERQVCIDTTAAGGNASLMAAAG